MAKRNAQMSQFMDVARMPFEHVEEADVVSVTSALAVVDASTRRAWPKPRGVAGTIGGLRRTERWASAELLEYLDAGRELVGKVPIGMRPAILSEFERRTGGTLEDGQEVNAFGIFEISAMFKPLRFIVERIDLINTISESRVARVDLLTALEKEGILAANRARPCPDQLSRIGLVHPIGGGAGLEDFSKKLEATPPAVVVNRYPVGMQGADAGQAMAGAVERAIAMGNELVVLVRGGGPTSDLAAFDSESLCRVICAAPVPVIVGVGHASDRSLADEVAYKSVSTPTAAAVWVLEHAKAHAEKQQETRAREERDDLQRKIQVAQMERVQSSRRERIAIGCAVALAALLLLTLIL